MIKTPQRKNIQILNEDIVSNLSPINLDYVKLILKNDSAYQPKTIVPKLFKESSVKSLQQRKIEDKEYPHVKKDDKYVLFVKKPAALERVKTPCVTRKVRRIKSENMNNFEFKGLQTPKKADQHTED